jgi:hypothetical protein
LGLPRNKRTVVPLFTFLFKVVEVREEYGSLMAKAVGGKFGKVPEPKSYEQVSLVKLTLPWLRFK